MLSGRGGFLLALALTSAIAAVDLVVGDSALLIELMAAGPLVAAARLRALPTAIVALYAVALALVNGLVGDVLGEAQHVVGLLAVAGGGALAVVLAHLRTARELDSTRLAAQYGVVRSLAGSDTLAEAAPRLLEAIGQPLGWDLGLVWEIGDDGAARCVADWSRPGVSAEAFRQASEELHVAPGKGLPGWVWETGRPAWLPDAVTDDRFVRKDAARGTGVRGAVAFPVFEEGQVAAVVELFARELRPPDEQAMELLDTLAAQVSGFLVRVRAREEREQLLELERLARLDATSAREELETILSGIADGVTAQAADGRLLYANGAAVATLGFETNEALLAAPPAEILSRFDMFDEAGEPFPPERFPGRRALAGEGRAEAMIRFRVRATGEERWSVVKATPIHHADGRVLMAINVIEDITRHKRAELAQRFLAEAGRLLGSTLDRDELMRRVAELAVPEIADWCIVDLVEPDGQLSRVAMAHADPLALVKGRELNELYPVGRDDDLGPARVIRRGRTELYEEVPPDLVREAAVDDRHLELITAFGPRSVLSVPVIVHDHVIGALTLASGESGRRFDRRDVELAEELARRCATAVDHARLYSERAHIASTLQRSLLPAELPDIPGVEAAARFRPAGEANEVGGDFYDLFSTQGGGFGVAVGDVCGKGPEAAAVTALARYTLRAAAMREQLPSRTLAVLNEALLRQRRDRRFCTMAYAHLRPDSDGVRLGLASGGHPLPVLVRAEGTAEYVGAPGTLLGVVADPSFEDRALVLGPGDALVFYTDGVIEDRGHGGLDEIGLVRVLGGCAGQGADAIAARVEDEAVRSQGGEPRDDIAVVVLRVAEDGAL